MLGGQPGWDQLRGQGGGTTQDEAVALAQFDIGPETPPLQPFVEAPDG